jgi:uncharacterized protein YbbC (DUF1343 family)
MLLCFSVKAAPGVQLGNEVLATNGFKELQGKRVGLLTNPSGVNRALDLTIDVLRSARSVKLVALFAAEHGLAGNVPAGIEYPNSTDKRTGLPVYSLYGPGPTRRPTPKMLQDLDALVYDIQDTGCRSYTFISSMGLAMEACAEAGVEFIVLDRPNPLGGERIEGPLLDSRFRSMVGQWRIPYVYGLTSGELARMINGEGWIKKACKLTVVPMRGWQRHMVWRDTGLLWVPTSPYIPQGDSPLHYVSTGILGQIGGVSIGIGYTLPFQCIAAPWLDGDKFSEILNGYGLPGVKFQRISYVPFYGAFHGKTNQGVQVFFTDARRAPLMAINYYALDAVKKSAGRDLFAEAVKSKRNFEMLDKVNGTDAIRKALSDGRSPASLVQSWKADEEAFRKQRAKYLLY